MSQINITINDETVELPSGFTVADMLSHLHLDAEKVAVERNLEIVPAADFSACGLCDADKIEIVHFIGGG